VTIWIGAAGDVSAVGGALAAENCAEFAVAADATTAASVAALIALLTARGQLPR
jgi:hypothetical protein